MSLFSSRRSMFIYFVRRLQQPMKYATNFKHFAKIDWFWHFLSKQAFRRDFKRISIDHIFAAMIFVQWFVSFFFVCETLAMQIIWKIVRARNWEYLRIVTTLQYATCSNCCYIQIMFWEHEHSPQTHTFSFLYIRIHPLNFHLVFHSLILNKNMRPFVYTHSKVSKKKRTTHTHSNGWFVVDVAVVVAAAAALIHFSQGI